MQNDCLGGSDHADKGRSERKNLHALERMCVLDSESQHLECRLILIERFLDPESKNPTLVAAPAALKHIFRGPECVLCAPSACCQIRPLCACLPVCEHSRGAEMKMGE